VITLAVTARTDKITHNQYQDFLASPKRKETLSRIDEGYSYDCYKQNRSLFY